MTVVSIEQTFLNARTFNKFTTQEVSDALIAKLYDLIKWGPTSMNCQPGHYVVVKRPEAKKRLLPALMPGNNEAMAQQTAFRNNTLQGGYLIIAARMLGLDCGPMSGFNNHAVDAEFFPDGRYKSNFLVNIGFGDSSGNHPRGPRLPFEQAVDIL